MSTAAASAKDVTAFYTARLQLGRGFLGLAVQRQKIPLRRGRNYCDSARINCASMPAIFFLAVLAKRSSADFRETLRRRRTRPKPVRARTSTSPIRAGRRAPDRGQRCRGSGRLPIGPSDGRRRTVLETPRARGHDRRESLQPAAGGAAPALGAAQTAWSARHGPQAWATEMQLATKTMLRSVNKQRLKRVKRPRKLKDALALESSPKDVRRASKLAGFIRSRPPPRPPLAGGTGPREAGGFRREEMAPL